MRGHGLARWCLPVIAMSLAASPALAQPAVRTPKAAERAPREPEGVDFNLEDADLPALIKAIGNITGKRFIHGDKLRAIKATVVSPEKISAAEAYQVFLSILAAHGMTVVPHGRFLSVVETTGAATQTLEVYGPSAKVPDEARYITRIHRLAHADPNDAAAVLAKLKSKDGEIVVHAPGNLLFLTDTGANVRRMLDVLAEVDLAGTARQLWIEPIHHVAPSQIAARLTDVFDLGRSEGGRPAMRVVADDRGGSLVIAASEADYRRVLPLIERLDTPPNGDGEIRVLRLQHATCKDLTQTLALILGGGAARAPGQPASTTAADGGFEGAVRTTCDEPLNAVVSTASPRDQARLRTVIEKLDRPRRQVFIEATIMDINVDRASDVGIAYHGGSSLDTVGSGKSLLYGGNAMKTSLAGVPSTSNLEGLVFGLRGPEIPGAQNILGTGISLPSFGAVFSAVANDGDANVLATPHILATDNVKAEISIGQNIALQTNVNTSSLAALAGASGAAGAAASLASGSGAGNGQRTDVGTKISVTPHVNAGDQVRMELVEEISEAGDALGTLGAVPIQKRTASTTLVVKDQQTVIIGGLVRTLDVDTETSIPVLGDIPLLGYLFKQKSKKKQRSNLILVLTPTIVRDQDDLRAIFERKMQERQEMIDRYFVFGDAQTWKPPQDYRRANGLLEDVRQSMLAAEAKRRDEAAAAPPAPKTHTPGQPLARPAPSASR